MNRLDAPAQEIAGANSACPKASCTAVTRLWPPEVCRAVASYIFLDMSRSAAVSRSVDGCVYIRVVVMDA